jgi:hypothetical protein
MNKLKDIFCSFIGKIIKINLIENDSLYYTKKSGNIVDLDKVMTDKRDFDASEKDFSNLK